MNSARQQWNQARKERMKLQRKQGQSASATAPSDNALLSTIELLSAANALADMRHAVKALESVIDRGQPRRQIIRRLLGVINESCNSAMDKIKR